MDPTTLPGATVAAVLALYLAPTMIAFVRGHASRWAILLVNVFLGWTILCWFVALVWSASASRHPSVTNVNVSYHGGANRD